MTGMPKICPKSITKPQAVAGTHMPSIRTLYFDRNHEEVDPVYAPVYVVTNNDFIWLCLKKLKVPRTSTSGGSYGR
jgi:hypothetical protein